MVLPALVGLGQAGVSFFGKYGAAQRQHKQAKERLKMQHKMPKAQAISHNQGVRDRNAYALMVHQIKKQQGEQTKRLAGEAANRAWLGNAINRDSQLRQMAFARQGRQAELMEAVGAGYAAMEGESQSRNRALMMNTFGRYGRNEVQDLANVQGVNDKSRLAAQDIRGQLQSTINRVNAETYIPPYMEKEVGMPQRMKMPSGPSGWEIGLMGAGSLLSGAMAYDKLAGDGYKLSDMFTKNWGQG